VERDLSKDFITINSHYFLHIVDLIQKFGPPWRWSNFIREMLIGALKPFYKNTNYTNVEVSVFGRYKSILFLHLIDILKAGNTVFRSSHWAPVQQEFIFSTEATVHWQRTVEDVCVATHARSLPRFEDRCFKINNKRYATLGHEEVREGNYLNMRPPGNSEELPDNHIGIFVGVVSCGEEAEAIYIVYKLPTEDTIVEAEETGDSNIYANLLRNRITTAVIPRRYMVVPLANYIRKVAVFYPTINGQIGYALKLN
jgi:hypothetical protein